jgi:aspartyl-tRNA(Asn)/glutamyl-tRNA(Gln) amidotransferase subunit C
MISKEEIKKMADLSRVEIGDNEAETLRGEMDAILDYIGQISHFTKTSGDEFESTQIHNVMREDNNPTEPGTYSEELIAEFPNKENNYLKVKKIL